MAVKKREAGGPSLLVRGMRACFARQDQLFHGWYLLTIIALASFVCAYVPICLFTGLLVYVVKRCSGTAHSLKAKEDVHREEKRREALAERKRWKKAFRRHAKGLRIWRHCYRATVQLSRSMANLQHSSANHGFCGSHWFCTGR